MTASRAGRAPTLAVTSGDPCGIGAEVVLGALARPRPASRLIVVGDLAVYERIARRRRRRLPAWRVVRAGDAAADPSASLVFLDVAHRARFLPGRSGAQAGAASLAYLEAATALCESGVARGLVTAPVTKWAIRRSQPRFVGHTEFLIERFGVRDVAMMFASDALRVVLLTRHLPLRAVPPALTREAITSTIRLTVDGLRRQFRIARPRLAVCGLNPHAGERGAFGDHERRVMEPALRRLRREGIRCDGPLAADGFFATRAKYDAVVACYHDQGLIPFKLLARDAGCQVSLGLPIVRTSPDHGSALEIAGKGLANPGSMAYAIGLASTLARRRSSRSAN